MTYNIDPHALAEVRRWIAGEAVYIRRFQFSPPIMAIPAIAFAAFARGVLTQIPPTEEREATWKQALRIYTQLLRREVRHAKHVR